MFKKLFGFYLVTVVALASPAEAQIPGSFDITVYGGAYLPTQKIIDQNITGEGQVTAKQKEGYGAGARLTFWLAALGVEGNVAYLWTDAEVTDDTGTESQSANVWVADARAIWSLLPGPIGVHLDGGIALIGRSGDAYQGVSEGKTNVGGVLGAGLRFKLPGLLSIRADADAYLYEAKLTDDTGFQSEGKFQADILISLGLVFGLGV